MFFYLLSVVPCIWLLEFHKLHCAAQNVRNTICLLSSFIYIDLAYLYLALYMGKLMEYKECWAEFKWVRSVLVFFKKVMKKERSTFASTSFFWLIRFISNVLTYHSISWIYLPKLSVTMAGRIFLM